MGRRARFLHVQMEQERLIVDAAHDIEFAKKTLIEVEGDPLAQYQKADDINVFLQGIKIERMVSEGIMHERREVAPPFKSRTASGVMSINESSMLKWPSFPPFPSSFMILHMSKSDSSTNAFVPSL